MGYSYPSHMAYLGKRYSLSSTGPPSPVMDHLSCFYPGMLALGVEFGLHPGNQPMAENLTHTCYHMYNSTSPTGLAPEIFQFNSQPGSKVDVLRSSVSVGGGGEGGGEGALKTARKLFHYEASFNVCYNVSKLCFRAKFHQGTLS